LLLYSQAPFALANSQRKAGAEPAPKIKGRKSQLNFIKRLIIIFIAAAASLSVNNWRKKSDSPTRALRNYFQGVVSTNFKKQQRAFLFDLKVSASVNIPNVNHARKNMILKDEKSLTELKVNGVFCKKFAQV
jgi:hypothetical protein